MLLLVKILNVVAIAQLLKILLSRLLKKKLLITGRPMVKRVIMLLAELILTPILIIQMKMIPLPIKATNNVIINWADGPLRGSNCFTEGNMAKGNFGTDPINVTGVEWTDIFVNPKGVTANSDYHFKGDYAQYNTQCGIYAGTGFSDSALPPVPYITAKQIPEQTDAEGKLNIKIRVRAGE